MQTVLKAKNVIQRQDPAAWDKALRVFMQDVFDGIKENAGGDITNVGGKFYKQMFGSKRQQKILQAAMSDTQFSNFKDFNK